MRTGLGVGAKEISRCREAAEAAAAGADAPSAILRDGRCRAAATSGNSAWISSRSLRCTVLSSSIRPWSPAIFSASGDGAAAGLAPTTAGLAPAPPLPRTASPTFTAVTASSTAFANRS